MKSIFLTSIAVILAVITNASEYQRLSIVPKSKSYKLNDSTWQSTETFCSDEERDAPDSGMKYNSVVSGGYIHYKINGIKYYGPLDSLIKGDISILDFETNETRYKSINFRINPRRTDIKSVEISFEKSFVLGNEKNDTSKLYNLSTLKKIGKVKTQDDFWRIINMIEITKEFGFISNTDITLLTSQEISIIKHFCLFFVNNIKYHDEIDFLIYHKLLCFNSKGEISKESLINFEKAMQINSKLLELGFNIDFYRNMTLSIKTVNDLFNLDTVNVDFCSIETKLNDLVKFKKSLEPVLGLYSLSYESIASIAKINNINILTCDSFTISTYKKYKECDSLLSEICYHNFYTTDNRISDFQSDLGLNSDGKLNVKTKPILMELLILTKRYDVSIYKIGEIIKNECIDFANDEKAISLLENKVEKYNELIELLSQKRMYSHFDSLKENIEAAEAEYDLMKTGLPSLQLMELLKK